MVFWLILALLALFFAWSSWVLHRRSHTPAWRDTPTDTDLGGPMRGDGS
jgi:hypothetical protein